MAADPLVCQDDRTSGSCEDCAYLEAVEAGRIQPRTDLASRGADRAPVLDVAEDEKPANQTKSTYRK